MMKSAKIIMSCLEGKRNDKVAAELYVRPGTVAIWRNQLLMQLEQLPPTGQTSWDGASLAQTLDVSDDIGKCQNTCRLNVKL